MALYDCVVPCITATILRRTFARYGKQRALVAIDSIAVLEGSLSRRARALVTKCATIYQQELSDSWERTHRLEPLCPIPPLQ